MSLQALLMRDDIIKATPCYVWLDLFQGLIQKLADFHRDTKHIHNDVKPENIGISVSKNNNGTYSFSQINYFDLGNSHLKNMAVRGSFSKYQPPEAPLGFFTGDVKNEATDIYALGKSLQDVIDRLMKEPHDAKDLQALGACQNLVDQMTSVLQEDRPPLKKCRIQIEKIRLAHYSDEEVIYQRELTMNDPQRQLPSMRLDLSQ
jgi:serine/threonine protein kinase